MKDVKEKLKGTCVLNEKEDKANPDYIELLDAYGNPHQFIRSEWPLFELVKAESFEFKEGEMVDVLTKGEWCKVEYAFFAVGKHWFYNVNFKEKDTVHIAEEIRKIDPDSDLKKIADEVYKNFYKDKSVEMSLGCKQDCINMLIEMAKRVKK